MKNTILYEDEHLVCLEQPGTRQDAVIVSFSEMLMRPAPQQTIWAGGPIQKLGFAGIGFVAKASNWFPQSSVEKAAAVVQARIAKYPIRIGYGFSMGAWAVLHYAKLFDLDVSIAFSLQYSINPEEIVDRRFSKHFDPVLHRDMAITAGKGAAFNIVACDPRDIGDWESAQKIAQNLKIEIIPLLHAGHGSVRCVTNTQTLGSIFTAAMTGSREQIEPVLKAARRNAPARPSTIAYAIAQKKPRTAFAIYQKYKASFPPHHRAGFFFKFRDTPYQEVCFEEMMCLYDTQKGAHGFLLVLALFHKDMGRAQKARSYMAQALALNDTPHYRFVAQQINA